MFLVEDFLFVVGGLFNCKREFPSAVKNRFWDTNFPNPEIQANIFCMRSRVNVSLYAGLYTSTGRNPEIF